ncbi:DUF4856 domain-containing protein [Pseudoalteromonas phenolica]|uniref:Cadherin n=1 Tax=Pseudoalteromonas phenolica TaxID=161398 RepID=A0A0S2K198_9GAMM|nr:DUF4856 domain-containing protein [Pseudoalteromonas phenolica]ALO41839.1 Cadherin [Pseudoalteromonas phenolica]MBE0353601.1 hypothetical protein [Pseudoalteromonas phenolica O-BC30]RXF00372.1 DUF4856 domain-containing protein [Pseudoalteromonas phenolica O-BC30]
MTLRKSLLATSILAATLGLTACGGSSSNDTPDPTPAPTNQAPTDISLSASAITEDTLGVVVGTLSATDDNAEGATFTVADDRFEITEGSLKLKDSIAINFEQETEVKVTVTVKDAGGLTFDKELTLSVTDVEAVDGVNVYEFASKLGTGSSVAYTGQTARHALSAEIKHYMGLMTVEYIETNNIVAADVRAKLDALWGDYDSVSENPITHLGDDLSGYEQKTFAAISSSGKELSGKIAGADASKMYKEWEVEGNFKGVTEFGTQAKTPEGLVKHYFDLFIAQIEKVNGGDSLEDANGVAITKAYITPDGLDLVQLVQKHTLGALMFSQGTDDYLGEGLESDNKVAQKEGVLYTKLEHQYDEGFGYFGASRNYLEYSDDEIAKKGGRDEFQGKNDIDGDGVIDLASEFVWGNSSNAAKRDRGAEETTDFTAEAMVNFIAGRKIITDNFGTDVADFSDELKAQFNKHVFDAALGWEKAIAATVVHYINDSISDIENLKDGEYTTDEFATYAKHWGEMKGFALNFQFSPFSPFAEDDLNPKKADFGEAKFVEVHTLMGDKPLVTGTTEEFEAYAEKLRQARDILADAYDFAEENAKNW